MPPSDSRKPLGAYREQGGVRFRLFSAHATGVEVCLFDDGGDGLVESARLPLAREGDDLWGLLVPGLGAGQVYGYRVHGPYEPEAGHRFNPAKLLVDPCARAVIAGAGWSEALLGFVPTTPVSDRLPDRRDSAPWAPKCVVAESDFDWQDDRPPRTPWRDTVIYEAHVRGMTRRHPEVPEPLRGTYRGLVEQPVLDHLAGLGVTAVELMPVQHFVSERHLQESGRVNYWGYSPVAFAAPHGAYATAARGEQVTEFKAMVRGLHRRGLEVILDVVFNHTAEGDWRGPTLSLRGIDNRTYYRSVPGEPGHYRDFTGCGNTLDLTRPPVLRLVLDSLRYWVEEMHVDGFRFDLAAALVRRDEAFSAEPPFLRALAEDPVLSRVKLIAEPWDLGPGGYRLGRFPAPWREWNDRYRDAARRLWRGDELPLAELAERLAGSADLLGRDDHGPGRGVEFVAAHDGFTLEDLVSYEKKDNWDNGEQNRDGHPIELSRNWGAEGASDDPAVLALRDRARRNLIATLALCAGVPMLGHGDEMGRTQRGNNNAYCQDGPRTWIDWRLPGRHRDFLAFCRRALALRRRHGSGGERSWLLPGSAELVARLPAGARGHALGMCFPAAAGGRLLALLNGGPEPAAFRLPPPPAGWRTLLDTAAPEAEPSPVPSGALAVEPRSLRILIAP